MISATIAGNAVAADFEASKLVWKPSVVAALAMGVLRASGTRAANVRLELR